MENLLSKIYDKVAFYEEDSILNCREELMEEGKKTGYIIKDDNVIALIGYRE